MWLDVFNANPYGTNCWLLSADRSEEAVVIDPGFSPSDVRRVLEAANKTPVAVLATHAHGDHVGEAGNFAGEVPLFVHGADAVAFTDEAAWRAGFENPLAPVKELRTIDDGDVLRLAGLEITVMHTPGHTPGHCAFRIEADEAFCSGDLVFAGSVGRSDFPNSDPAAMRASLQRFLMLPDEVAVLPGHGPTTTVGRERASNPFLREPV
ncbi:MAG: MBL fold metallo-hydrolase [Actinomycetota bacterium]|nr:MBL fold metallo-hydrolase [Actinomycetota bacterium]MDH5223635.1 MBL fold metallo-hydrolase [Actinomycetota bacterium]